MAFHCPCSTQSWYFAAKYIFIYDTVWPCEENVSIALLQPYITYLNLDLICVSLGYFRENFHTNSTHEIECHAVDSTLHSTYMWVVGFQVICKCTHQQIQTHWISQIMFDPMAYVIPFFFSCFYAFFAAQWDDISDPCHGVYFSSLHS